jgi:hypothetical protein
LHCINYRCKKCKQQNTGYEWCNTCNSKRFQSKFDKWTSGDIEFDKFIQQIQLEAKNCIDVIEWIPFDKFKDVTYIAKGGFGTVSKAIWIDGCIFSWDDNNKNWARTGEMGVCLKSFHIFEYNNFLQEVNI